MRTSGVDRDGDGDHRAPRRPGGELLVVQSKAPGKADGEPVLAFDRMGARRGDMVIGCRWPRADVAEGGG